MIVQHTRNYATTETYMLTCDKCWRHVTTEFRGFQSRNFDVHGKMNLLIFPWNDYNAV